MSMKGFSVRIPGGVFMERSFSFSVEAQSAGEVFLGSGSEPMPLVALA